ncbi:MAG: nucleotidyltransferase domain-containing protein [Candidatus Micrarchaeota archaeon]
MSLLEFLKREPNARLIFGKKELAIIRKQLLGETLTQSERNRLSKFIRPKLRFIESCSKYAGEFEVKRRKTFDKIIEKTKEVILKDKKGKDVLAILLFGSHAEGKPTYRSDIDLCVLFDDISTNEAVNFRLRVLRETSDLADVQVFNTLPIWVKVGIAQNYKILYKGDEFNEDFWINVIKTASESRVMKLHEAT